MPSTTEINDAIRRAKRDQRSGKDRSAGEREDESPLETPPPAPRRSAAADFQDLPKPLATKHADLLAALANSKDPQGEWSGEKYLQAHAPADVGRILIGALHPVLQGRVIKWLWREHMTGRGVVLLGKARLASGLVGHFSRADFILEFNWTEWQDLSERQRVALVDHELTHCSTDLEKGTSLIVPHDVEEFGSIVEKWGLWRPPLKRFAEIVTAAAQLALGLEETPARNGSEPVAAEE